MRIQQLVYTSVATQPFDDAQLQELLQKARDFNHAQRLTGILLYSSEGKFLQVLEGEPDAVRDVYQRRIGADPRHTNLEVLTDGLAPSRVFPDWSMGFVRTQPTDFAQLTGYVSPERPTFLLARAHSADPQLLELLRGFVAINKVEA